MLDLPGQPILDKTALIGGCVRLPLQVDAERLRAEVAALPAELWGSGGRVGVHNVAQSVFLRGFAPAEGEKPIEDRPPLLLLPYAKRLISELVGALPLRCLLARLPAGTSIIPHVDRAPYFAKTLRLHFPIESNEDVWMMSASLWYQMVPGEVWALNNSAVHGVVNAHEDRERTHMICDFLPGEGLSQTLARGERNLGAANRAMDLYFNQEANGYV
jgi:hypothetical protein